MTKSFSLSAQIKNYKKPIKISDSLSIEMPQVVVIGKRDGMINKVPGSGAILNQKEIKLFSPRTLNEVLHI